jgi:hypothetical protein
MYGKTLTGLFCGTEIYEKHIPLLNPGSERLLITVEVYKVYWSQKSPVSVLPYMYLYMSDFGPW